LKKIINNEVVKSNNSEKVNNQIKSLKCQLAISANGDYPLIRIADVRNSLMGAYNLWKMFNVDEANEELQKPLSEEEKNYIADENTDKKISSYKDKLKCITFNFGKHIIKKADNDETINIYLTLRNDGGVPTEFFFKFPGEVNIFREVWMEPVEPTSNDKIEYHIIKSKIFELEPKKGKLEPKECCIICLKYNNKEKGNHELNVIFQVVNGKPMIFKLKASCFVEKQGLLEIKKPIIDFFYKPIGYMDYIVTPLELCNVSGIKVKYKIDNKQIEDFNKKNDNFIIFKIEQLEGSIGPYDIKYIPIFFRPLTSKEYKLNINVLYTDESYYSKNDEIDGQKDEGGKLGIIPITLKGKGYHPLKFTPPKVFNPFEKMPKEKICNIYNGEIIQKCGLSIEEIDFGECELEVPKNKTFILYNYSTKHSLNFEFNIPGFILKDSLEIKPAKEVLEPNSHKIIKMILTPKGYISDYEGEIEISILWNNKEETEPKNLKEFLNLRIRKTTIQKHIQGKLERTKNNTQSFIETVLTDLTKEIINEEKYEDTLVKALAEQPLGLFDWINDVEYPSQAEVRELLNSKYKSDSRAILFSDNNSSLNVTKKLYHHSESKYFRKNDSQRTSFMLVDKNPVDNYGENEDYKIQDKYNNELLNKYKLTVGEVNEGMALVNEESRKIISSDIMENTIYNIISEAIYGECDLSEKTRIYFFNK